LIINNVGISILQTQDQLQISVFDDDMKLTKLYISPVYSETMLQTIEPTKNNTFSIDLKKLIKALEVNNIHSN